jgi:pyruvate/2-oxoacid:ferredoxin oxidoreductase beta subunit
MLKTIMLSLGCSIAAATATAVYVGRTVISSPFQMNIPYNSGVKVAQDPANVWSWHHTFQGVDVSHPGAADVLVDVDGNGVMDTEYSWLRVVVTDIQLALPNQLYGPGAMATISDGTGVRYSIGLPGFSSQSSLVFEQHISLATPIVLPVGGSLHVSVISPSGPADYDVNLIGRVVNL